MGSETSHDFNIFEIKCMYPNVLECRNKGRPHSQRSKGLTIWAYEAPCTFNAMYVLSLNAMVQLHWQLAPRPLTGCLAYIFYYWTGCKYIWYVCTMNKSWMTLVHIKEKPTFNQCVKIKDSVERSHRPDVVSREVSCLSELSGINQINYWEH